MARELGLEPDGDLFKMQQRAIKEARETASRASIKHNDTEGYSRNKHDNNFECEEEREPEKKKRKKSNKTSTSNNKNIIHTEKKVSGIMKNIMNKIKIEEIVIIALIFMLINEEADDELIIMLGIILLLGFFES